jgi:hypothetical protein
MATLTTGISATVRSLEITTPGSPRIGALYRIDDEVIGLVGYCRGIYLEVGGPGGDFSWDPDETCWYVDRGVQGTLAASHDAGATVEAFDVTDDLPSLTWTDDNNGNVYAITFDDAKLLITVTTDEDVLLGRIQFSNGGTAIASFDADGEVRSTITTTNGGSVQIETFDAELNNTGTISSDSGEVRIAGPGYATDLLLTATAIVLTGAPSADPEVAGALYTAGAPGPADPKALMVSGGPAA